MIGIGQHARLRVRVVPKAWSNTLLGATIFIFIVRILQPELLILAIARNFGHLRVITIHLNKIVGYIVLGSE